MDIFVLVIGIFFSIYAIFYGIWERQNSNLKGGIAVFVLSGICFLLSLSSIIF